MVCRCYSLHGRSLFQVTVCYLYMLGPFSPQCGANTLLIHSLCRATEVISQSELCLTVCVHMQCISNCHYTLRRDVLHVLQDHLYIDPRVILCNAIIFIWVQVTSSWHLSTQRAMRPAFAEHVPPPFQVVRSISTTIQITVLVMGYFKVWTGEKYFPCWILRMWFFSLPLSLSSKHDRNRNRKKKALFQQYLILYTERS